jgi:hypothetical protein
VESTSYQGMPTKLCRLPVFCFASSANPASFPHNRLQTRSRRGGSRRRRAVGGRIADVTSLLPCHARRDTYLRLHFAHLRSCTLPPNHDRNHHDPWDILLPRPRPSSTPQPTTRGTTLKQCISCGWGRASSYGLSNEDGNPDREYLWSKYIKTNTQPWSGPCPYSCHLLLRPSTPNHTFNTSPRNPVNTQDHKAPYIHHLPCQPSTHQRHGRSREFHRLPLAGKLNVLRLRGL